MIFLDIGCTCVIIIKFCEEWWGLYRGRIWVYIMVSVSVYLGISAQGLLKISASHNYVSHCVL